jgi:PRTRC genetic system protein B
MTGHVDVGAQLNFTLQKALLVYEAPRSYDRGGRDYHSFVTEHPVTVDTNGLPRIGEGSLLSRDFLDRLIESMRGRQADEFLPENVLVRTQDRIAFWIPGRVRTMFYFADRSPELVDLNGKRFPQPPLLFDVSRGNLSIFALKESKRPTKDTKLYRAPYWNVNDQGDVCLGSTRVPDALSVDSITRWADSFFESQFTHQNAGRPLTTHPNGFVALWRELKGKKEFPAKYLAGTGKTLGQYLKS